MKRTVFAICVVVVLALPASAQAHNSHGWFWSPALAESRYEAHYNVYAADCTGMGQWILSRPDERGRRIRLYRHFDCFDTDAQTGEQEEVILHVKGRFAFVVYNV